MICPNPNCGKKNEEDSLYCVYCGTALKKQFPVKLLLIILAAVVLVGGVVLFASTGRKTTSKTTYETVTVCEPVYETTTSSTSVPTTSVTSAPVTSTETTAVKHPSEADLAGAQSGLEHPRAGSWLSEYKTKYVKSTKGGGIYLLFHSYNTDNNLIKTIYDHTKVTVLAEQNDKSLVITEDGDIGWAASSKLVDNF